MYPNRLVPLYIYKQSIMIVISVTNVFICQFSYFHCPKTACQVLLFSEIYWDLCFPFFEYPKYGIIIILAITSGLTRIYVYQFRIKMCTFSLKNKLCETSCICSIKVNWLRLVLKKAIYYVITRMFYTFLMWKWEKSKQNMHTTKLTDTAYSNFSSSYRIKLMTWNMIKLGR